MRSVGLRWQLQGAPGEHQSRGRGQSHFRGCEGVRWALYTQTRVLSEPGPSRAGPRLALGDRRGHLDYPPPVLQSGGTSLCHVCLSDVPKRVVNPPQDCNTVAVLFSSFSTRTHTTNAQLGIMGMFLALSHALRSTRCHCRSPHACEGRLARVEGLRGDVALTVAVQVTGSAKGRRGAAHGHGLNSACL